MFRTKAGPRALATAPLALLCAAAPLAVALSSTPLSAGAQEAPMAIPAPTVDARAVRDGYTIARP